MFIESSKSEAEDMVVDRGKEANGELGMVAWPLSMNFARRCVLQGDAFCKTMRGYKISRRVTKEL